VRQREEEDRVALQAFVAHYIRSLSVYYGEKVVMGIGMLFQRSRWPMHWHPVNSRCPMVQPMVARSTGTVYCVRLYGGVVVSDSR
jgi:hypothetical protein